MFMFKMISSSRFNNIKPVSNIISRNVHYIQGQSPEPKIREYFYYIDHQGMLFLDDAKMKNFTSCFKEKTFLKFFFSRLKFNKTTRYQKDFPFISLCGRERNFVRCDDTPIVFSHLLPQRNDTNEAGELSYAHAGEVLKVPFQPDKIYMNARGRVYHPAWPEVGGIGLVRSKLAIELSRNFEFAAGEDYPPTHFMWNGTRLELANDWVASCLQCGMSEELKE